MKCIILAAGYATRLYPLTQNFPKPLLPVKNKPILDWLIDDLSGSDKVDSYIVVSNHKFKDHFVKWASSRKENIVVLDDGTCTNDTRLGAVKDISFALQSQQTDDDVLVIAGDNLLDFSLQTFLTYAQKKQASCIMRYYESNEEKLKKCGVVTCSSSDRILNMVEKPSVPQSHWCTPPFYYFKKEDACLVQKAIDDGCGTDAPGSFIVWLCQHVPVYAMKMPGKRYDIGNLESYQKIEKMYAGSSDSKKPLTDK